jgi:hypothetical protein
MTVPAPEQIEWTDTFDDGYRNGYAVGYSHAEGKCCAAADELDRLRALIEKAPHDQQCAYRLPITMRIPEDKCTCWKADAL